MEEFILIGRQQGKTNLEAHQLNNLVGKQLEETQVTWLHADYFDSESGWVGKAEILSWPEGNNKSSKHMKMEINKKK